MEIVITIHEKDIIAHSGILDTLCQLAKQIDSVHTGTGQIAAVKKESLEVEITEKGQGIDAEERNPVKASDSKVEEEPPAEEVPSLEEVRAVLAQVGKKHGAAKAKELLAQFGASKLTNLSSNHYAAVMRAAKEVQ